MTDLEVVEGDLQPTAKAPARAKSAPQWELAARDRVRSGIRKFSKPLAEMVARDANEGDTRLLVTDMLCATLGYDKFADLTTEYQVKGEFADYSLRIDKQLVAFIEVKRVTTKLGAKHLRQVEMYAVNEGVEWVILTNGVEWQVYHLTAGLPVIIDLVMTVNLLDDTSPSHKANLLFYLTRESFKRDQIDQVWLARRATSPKSLTIALMSDPVLTALRKELKRITGHSVEVDELRKLLPETVFRSDIP